MYVISQTLNNYVYRENMGIILNVMEKSICSFKNLKHPWVVIKGGHF